MTGTCCHGTHFISCFKASVGPLVHHSPQIVIIHSRAYRNTCIAAWMAGLAKEYRTDGATRLYQVGGGGLGLLSVQEELLVPSPSSAPARLTGPSVLGVY